MGFLCFFFYTPTELNPFSLWGNLDILLSLFLNIYSRYRKALSNNCTEGSALKYSPRRQKCPSQAPRGLQLFTSEATLVAALERNVTFLVFLEEVQSFTLTM